MKATKITQNGQVTIPVSIREKLDIHAGDKLVFEARNNQIIISKQKNDITAAFGMIRVDKNLSHL